MLIFIRFQYVALQLEALKKVLSPGAAENALRDLPAGLDETYNRILLRIGLQDREQAYRTLKWLAFSRRPLTIDELAEASIIDIAATPPFSEDRRCFASNDLLRLFPGLLILGDTIALEGGTTGKAVKFSHFSVQEYLMSERIKSSDAAAFHLDKKNPNLELARSCLRYCLHMDQSKPKLYRLDLTFPFKNYALVMWLRHFEALEQECCDSHLTNMALKTLEPESWLFKQVASHNYWKYLRYSYLVGVTSTDDYLDSGIKSNPLYLVVELGYLQSTSLLIRHGVADVNKIGGPWRTALNVAAGYGRESIVRVLLEAGANAYAHTLGERDAIKRYSCALEIAVYGEEEDVARILLQQPGAVKKCEELGYRPLVDAAYRSNASMTELLLKHGFDPNRRSHSRSALRIEVECGHLDGVELLLQYGANVNDFEVKEIYDPIKIAAAKSIVSDPCLSIVRLLLLRGAEVRKPVDEDWSKWISEGRTKELVRQDVYALYEICGDLSQRGGFNESNVDAYVEEWKGAIGYESRRSKFLED